METLGLHDIIGPVMVGPSSSHTAGALRIARMARLLLGQQPSHIHFTLYESFAHTGKGHGTDKALVAGALGYDTSSLEIRDSFELAKQAGMEVEFTFDETSSAPHPNTVDIVASTPDGETLHMRGVSVGGGAASIRNIDGIDVDIMGDKTSLVVKQDDVTGVLAHIASCVAQAQVNIATTRMYRTRKGSAAYTVMEIDGDLSQSAQDAILSHPRIHSLRVIPSSSENQLSTNAQWSERDQDEAEQRFTRYDFATGAELLQLCQEQGLSIGALYKAREEALQSYLYQVSEEQACQATASYVSYALEVMEQAATGPLSQVTPSTGGLIGGETKALWQTPNDDCIVDDLTKRAMAYGMAVLETNASMGRIVAAPTAGSAGVIPAVLFALRDKYQWTQEQLAQGLYCAGAIGMLVAQNSTVSGAQGGCQAEVGAACAMAAAAATELCGGTPAQALDAASNAFMALMGLVCDPIGGLVEVPCQKRNATAAATALVCAQMALCGISNLVPFDEAVSALDAVGKSLPFELRESALGGIAATPSACALCNKCK